MEHPAYSDAFAAYGIPAPRGVGWQRLAPGEWVGYVEQRHYGHVAKKATWLYAHGVDDPPPLNRRRMADRDSEAIVSWCGNHTDKFDKRPRVGKGVASATPAAFKALLLDIARSARASTERAA